MMMLMTTQNPVKAASSALLFALLALTFPARAAAQEPTEEGAEEIEFAPPRLVPYEEDSEQANALNLEFSGHIQFWADTFERPADQGRREGVYQQTRLATAFGRGTLRAVAEADFFSGQLLGPGIPLPPSIGDHGARPFQEAFADPARFLDPRKLYLQWGSPAGILRVGLQTSQWGLGLLANGGESDDYFFHTNFGGDRVARALFATAPLRPLSLHPAADDLLLAIGVDAVFRDENADWLGGDRAYQAIASLLWNHNATSLGAYTAIRRQTDRDDSTLNVTALDAFAEQKWDREDSNWSFRLGAEAAYLLGETTRADGLRGGDPVSVDAFGTALEADANYQSLGLNFRLRSGFASGDANPSSPTMHRFRFDPNYRAGLLLYDHYLPAWTQHSVDHAHDELRLRDAPRGIDNLVESGSVTNSFYIHPQAIWQTTDQLAFATGFLAAFAHRTVRDLMASVEEGGVPVGAAGSRNPGRLLGWEAQLGARFKHDLLKSGPGLTLEYRAEAALLVPGNAFYDAADNPSDPTGLLRAFITAAW